MQQKNVAATKAEIVAFPRCGDACVSVHHNNPWRFLSTSSPLRLRIFSQRSGNGDDSRSLLLADSKSISFCNVQREDFMQVIFWLRCILLADISGVLVLESARAMMCRNHFLTRALSLEGWAYLYPCRNQQNAPCIQSLVLFHRVLVSKLLGRGTPAAMRDEC